MTIAAGAARRRKTAMTMAALPVHARVRAMTMMMIEAVAVAMAAGTAIAKDTRRPRAAAVSSPHANATEPPGAFPGGFFPVPIAWWHTVPRPAQHQGRPARRTLFRRCRIAGAAQSAVQRHFIS